MQINVPSYDQFYDVKVTWLGVATYEINKLILGPNTRIFICKL